MSSGIADPVSWQRLGLALAILRSRIGDTTTTQLGLAGAQSGVRPESYSCEWTSIDGWGAERYRIVRPPKLAPLIKFDIV